MYTAAWAKAVWLPGAAQRGEDVKLALAKAKRRHGQRAFFSQVLHQPEHSAKNFHRRGVQLGHGAAPLADNEVYMVFHLHPVWRGNLSSCAVHLTLKQILP